MSNYQQSSNPQKRNWRPKFGPNKPKIRAKIRFFVIFFKFGSLVFLEMVQDNSWEHCLTTRRVKTLEKIFWAPNWVRNQSSCHFLQVASLVFLDITLDFSSGKGLTSSKRAETSTTTKRKCGRNDIVERPLKLACLFKRKKHIFSKFSIIIIQPNWPLIRWSTKYKSEN